LDFPLPETKRAQPLRCQTCTLRLRASNAVCPFTTGRGAAGTTLLRRDRVPESVVYLRRGHVALSSSSERAELLCAVRGAGALLGLEAVVSRRLPYDVHTIDDATFCTVNVEAFKAWLGPLDSPLGSALLFALDETMRRTGERHRIDGSATRRVARLLSDEEEGAMPSDVPHAVLARVLGMRPETLSRALADLRRCGALAPGRKICVVDRDALSRAAK
jgi:CRP-like cAMP-binding protein